MKSKIAIDSHRYEMSHMHKPRGRGAWAFYFAGDATNGTETWWARAPTGIVSMTFAEARRLALHEAARRGAHTLFVAP